MCAGIKIQHCRIGSKRSEIVGLNRSGLSALGNVHSEMPVDDKQSLSRDGHHWVSHLLSPSFDLVESIFYIFNIFTATPQTESCNGSSFAWLTHWVTSLKLLVSPMSQVSRLDGSVIELFSYSCVHYARPGQNSGRWLTWNICNGFSSKWKIRMGYRVRGIEYWVFRRVG